MRASILEVIEFNESVIIFCLKWSYTGIILHQFDVWNPQIT